MMPRFLDSMVELITRTSTDLPPDVRAAMRDAVKSEEPSTRSGQALTIIAQNIDQAASCEGPICQDTGMPTFEVRVPIGANQIWMRTQTVDVSGTRRRCRPRGQGIRDARNRQRTVSRRQAQKDGANRRRGNPILQ